jgi:hypothetical protein
VYPPAGKEVTEHKRFIGPDMKRPMKLTLEEILLERKKQRSEGRAEGSPPPEHKRFILAVWCSDSSIFPQGFRV